MPSLGTVIRFRKASGMFNSPAVSTRDLKHDEDRFIPRLYVVGDCFGPGGCPRVARGDDSVVRSGRHRGVGTRGGRLAAKGQPADVRVQPVGHGLCGRVDVLSRSVWHLGQVRAESPHRTADPVDHVRHGHDAQRWRFRPRSQDASSRPIGHAAAVHDHAFGRSIVGRDIRFRTCGGCGRGVQPLFVDLAAVRREPSTTDIDHVAGVGDQTNGTTFEKERRNQGDVVVMARRQPGIVGEQHIARNHRVDWVLGQEVLHAFGYRVDVTGRARNRLSQHAALPVEHRGGEIPRFPDRGGKGRPNQGLGLFFDDGDEPIPHDVVVYPG